MSDYDVNHESPDHTGADGEFLAVEHHGFPAEPQLGPAPLSAPLFAPQQSMLMDGQNFLAHPPARYQLAPGFRPNSGPSSTSPANPEPLTRHANTQKRVTPVFPNMASCENFIIQQCHRPKLETLAGPEYGPPTSVIEERAYVRIMLESFWDFSSFTLSRTIPTGRRVEDICCHPEMNSAEKLSAILGAEYDLSDVMLEAFCFHMLQVAVAMHHGDWKIQPWAPLPEIEEFPSFSGRWLAMCVGFRDVKSLIKSVIVEQAFVERYIMAPGKETKVKLTNKGLNDKRKGDLAAGKSAQQASARACN